MQVAQPAPQPVYANASPAVGLVQSPNSLYTGHFGGHHVYPGPTQFILQDKTIYTGNLRKGTHVLNPNGSVAFQTKDAVFSLKNKEVVYDALNQPIASLHHKTISLHGTWQIFRGDSTSNTALVAEIKPQLINLVGKKIKVTIIGKTEPELVIEGNFISKEFEFKDAHRRVIAEARRHGKFANAMNFMSGEDTFTLTIQPGVDTALLVMCTLVIDDILAGGKER